jgi:hypothetical protein
MWRRIDLVWTDVSKERIASIFRVENSRARNQREKVTADWATSQNIQPCFPMRPTLPPSLFLHSWVFSTGGSVCSHLLMLVPRSRIFLLWRWRRYVPLKRRFTQELHSATSQKTALFNWKYCKTLTWKAACYGYLRYKLQDLTVLGDLKEETLVESLTTYRILLFSDQGTNINVLN